MIFRSPHLLDRESSALLVVDVQQKLIPVIENGPTVVANSAKLMEAASILGVPVLVSEQYPKGLGPTVEELDTSKAAIVEAKTMFSCRGCPEILRLLEKQGVKSVLLCGVEAHVCIAQTAFDLLAIGLQVHVAVDAIGSRSAADHQTAVSRMAFHGIVATSTEAAIFEWCETSTAAEFKQISSLVVRES